MRTVIDAQLMFGQTDIAAIVLDSKSRDDIPQLLRGLQHLYTEPQLRERVFVKSRKVINRFCERDWDVTIATVLRLVPAFGGPVLAAECGDCRYCYPGQAP